MATYLLFGMISWLIFSGILLAILWHLAHTIKARWPELWRNLIVDDMPDWATKIENGY